MSTKPTIILGSLSREPCISKSAFRTFVFKTSICSDLYVTQHRYVFKIRELTPLFMNENKRMKIAELCQSSLRLNIYKCKIGNSSEHTNIDEISCQDIHIQILSRMGNFIPQESGFSWHLRAAIWTTMFTSFQILWTGFKFDELAVLVSNVILLNVVYTTR